MGYVGVYRPNYYEGNPWHPERFLKGEIDTLPYEHDSIVLYRGISNHEFFKAESSFDDSPSILKKELMAPSNVFYEDRGIESYEKFSSKQHAVYMGVLSIGRIFGLINEKKGAQYWEDRSGAEGAVIELQVPTKPLWTLMAKKPLHMAKLKRRANVTEFKPHENLEELKNGLGLFGNDLNNSENLRKLIRKAASAEDPTNGSSFSTGQVIHWATQYPVSLDNVTGVWDLHFNSKKPLFESLEEYVTDQRQKHPKKMPHSSKYYVEGKGERNTEIKNTIRREMSKIEQIEESYIKIVDIYEEILETINEYHRIRRSKNTSQLRENLIDLMEKYIRERQNLIETVEPISDVSPHEVDSWDFKYRDIVVNHKAQYKWVKKFKDDLEESYSEEKYHYYNTSWNKKKVKKEAKAEELINNKLARDAFRLPNIKPAYQQIKANESSKVFQTTLRYFDKGAEAFEDVYIEPFKSILSSLKSTSG